MKYTRMRQQEKYNTHRENIVAAHVIVNANGSTINKLEYDIIPTVFQGTPKFIS